MGNFWIVPLLHLVGDMRSRHYEKDIAAPCRAATHYCKATTQLIVLVLLLLLLLLFFMQGIYTYIPETNYVPKEYSVAAFLLLLFMVLISLVSVLNLLYFYISTFQSMCAVPNMADICSSLTSCFPGMLLTYFLNELK